MAAKLTPFRLVQAGQPTAARAPDWTNPITRGLELLWHGGDRGDRNSAQRSGATASGSGIATRVYPQGVARAFDGSATYLSWPTNELSTNHDFTIFMVMRSHDVPPPRHRLFHVGVRSAGAGGVLTLSDWYGGSTLSYEKISVGQYNSGVECPLNVPCVVALTYNATSGDLVFTARNLLTGAVATDTQNNSSAHSGNSGEVGLSQSSADSGNCAIFMSAFWWRTLAKLEIESLIAAPWQLFAKRQIMLPRQVAAASSSPLGMFDADLRIAAWF